MSLVPRRRFIASFRLVPIAHAGDDASVDIVARRQVYDRDDANKKPGGK
jgi:hypothetical protein